MHIMFKMLVQNFFYYQEISIENKFLFLSLLFYTYVP